jgi:hypothetical protein
MLNEFRLRNDYGCLKIDVSAVICSLVHHVAFAFSEQSKLHVLRLL